MPSTKRRPVITWPLFAAGALLEGVVWAFIEPPTTLPVVLGLWTTYQVWSLRVALIHGWRRPGDGGRWLTARRFLEALLAWGSLAAVVGAPAYFAAAALWHMLRR
jgi:hypothetical protein